MLNIGKFTLPSVINNQTPSNNMSKLQTKFDTAMQAAEGAYLKRETATLQDKEAMVVSLNEAWEACLALQQPEQQKSLNLARIAVLRGKCRWAEDDMEVSRQVFSLSLALAQGKLQKVEEIPEFQTESLENLLIRLVNQKNTFEDLENELANPILKDNLSQTLIGNAEATDLAIADAAREMGSVYQNHKDYRITESDNDIAKERKACLFENAISIAETIWERLDTPETQWLRLICKYNTGPRRLSNRDPNDVKGRCDIYRQVLEALDRLEKNGDTSVRIYQQRAQCYNMLAQLQEPTRSSLETFQDIAKAGDIAFKYTDKGFNTFLARMFLHNKANFAFRCLENKSELPSYINRFTIDQWHDQVQVLCEKEGYSHFYDAMFCLSAAKVALSCSYTEKAKLRLRQALKVCDQHKSSTDEIRKEIEKFCADKKIDPNSKPAPVVAKTTNKSLLVRFHGQFTSVLNKLPEHGKGKEIVKRIAIVVVAPLAYIALSFAYIVGKVFDCFWKPKTVVPAPVSPITDQHVKDKVIEIGRIIRDAKSNDVTEVQSAKFFVHVEVNDIIRNNVFVMKNSKINVKKVDLNLADVVGGAFRSLRDADPKASIKIVCTGSIRHADGTYSHMAANNDTKGGSGSSISTHTSLKGITLALTQSAAMCGLAQEPQIDKDGDFTSNGIPVFQ